MLLVGSRAAKKGNPILEMSVRFQSWSQSSAVSPQVTETINQAVGCRYFPPGPRLPHQPQSITALWLVPNYTAWWQKHVCKQLAQGCTRQRGGWDLYPWPHVPLVPSSIIGTSQWAVMLCGWVFNRRSDVTLATRHWTLVVLHLQAQGLGEGDEHPPTLCCGVWLTIPLPFTCWS